MATYVFTDEDRSVQLYIQRYNKNPTDVFFVGRWFDLESIPTDAEIVEFGAFHTRQDLLKWRSYCQQTNRRVTQLVTS